MDQDQIKMEVEINDTDIQKSDELGEANAVASTPDLTNVEIKMDGQVVEFSNEDAGADTESTETHSEATEVAEVGKDAALSEALETANDLKNSFQSEGDKLQAVGLDLESLHQEFLDSGGKISEKTLEKVKEAGYSEQLIKGYLRGVVAAANEVKRQFLHSLGGEKEFTAMAEWAASNGDPQLVDAFNDAVERDDLKTAASIGKVLQREREAHRVRKYGTKQPHVLGSAATSAATSLQGFTSDAAMIKAINDPRYNSDSRYTEIVKAKILAMGN